MNIGNPHEISIRDFAEEIIKLTKSSQKVIYKDLPVDDPMQRQPDITLAKKVIGLGSVSFKKRRNVEDF